MIASTIAIISCENYIITGARMSDNRFELKTDYTPTGDQPEAINKLVNGYKDKKYKFQTLHGVTGSGKTFTASHIIAKLNKPTLVIAPNKTLAAQLFAEFKHFFPNNAVKYFVSFYDYYQPEAYMPTKDLYIAKDFNINEEIDKLRNASTKALAEREDVIIVASVSCIYNVGLPETYRDFTIKLKKGMELERDSLLSRLVELQYRRNEMDFKSKTFRAKGDRVEIKPIYQEEGIRVEFFGDEVEQITIIDPLTGNRIDTPDEIVIYPSTQYLTKEEQIKSALHQIRDDLRERVDEFEKNRNYVSAERITQRTHYDLEQLEELGYCSGIENYSRYFDGRLPGDPPYTLIDHFPDDFLMIVDESHVTLPQVRGMYGGDFSRKQNLINHGFRLPSAYDNRPLRWEEFEKRMPTTLFVSATPAEYELDKSDQVVEQIIRPTGLVDPTIDVRPSKNQVDDLMVEVEKRITRGERVLVTTLTKRMAEDLSDFFAKSGLKSQYMHSDIDTLERVQILNSLRGGEIDVLVGINLLREGLDLPEVSLVAILDADKQGFLRSTRSLTQIMGRAARNAEGMVILYADTISDSMREAITANNRRRKIQLKHNKDNNITPKTIVKGIFSVLETLSDEASAKLAKYKVDDQVAVSELITMIGELKGLMNEAADNLEFELAAELRDKIKELNELLIIERNK